ncbi:hypothetical protein [Sinorhizobium meliloti]|uniref:hypothetical protein n=1 Tax=Rhizobium meliloti TaxID=382 RepID=UPI00299DAD1E|nr:hypothetical protein [Sinorhizobium meliloti]MDW9991058.1 hypothetical protein [Sinorhizobium meliloti]MDX0245458.1 hypothetical protein [Sinorhizobium meliloti]MDX0401538.1 hypothetical protein [Sinorhizobium meliloti]
MNDEIDNETGNEIKLDVIPSPPKKKGGRRKRAVSEKEQERWQTDEWKDHLKKIGFQKGREKTGGRVATPKETKEWIAGKSINVAEFMWDLMNDDTQPIKERRAAAVWLGEMSMAKAPTEQKVEVNHTHDIGAMLLEAQRMATSKLIDVTPKPKAIEDDSDA